jgi:hypothetical protein
MLRSNPQLTRVQSAVVAYTIARPVIAVVSSPPEIVAEIVRQLKRRYGGSTENRSAPAIAEASKNCAMEPQ